MPKYKILNLIPGSDEWLEERLKHLCASEAPAVMDESKFMSRNQLLDLKKGWLSNPNSSFKEMLFQKGHEHEAMARPIFEFEEGEDFPPIVASFEVIRDFEYLLFLASFDGLGEDFGGVWEHKDWNLVLAGNIRNGVLEPNYYWQLEQQMIVAGVKEATITCSDGTNENRVSMIYKSVPKRRKDLIAASYQFMKDLDDHELEVKIEVVEKNKNISFPMITFETNGTEISSNISDCLQVFKDRAQFEMSVVLESDQDFADKDKMNKAVIQARSDLKSLVKKVKGKFLSYSEFDEVAEKIDKILLKMQSHGVKQVQQAKDKKKADIQAKGQQQLRDYVNVVNSVITPIKLGNLINCYVDFAQAMKNKRTIESLTNAVDSAVATWKIEVDKVRDLTIQNLETLRESASDHEHLFMDTPELVKKDNESLLAIIKNRISEYEIKEVEKRRVKLENKAKGVELIAKWQSWLDDTRGSDDLNFVLGCLDKINKSWVIAELFVDNSNEATSYLMGFRRDILERYTQIKEQSKKPKQKEEIKKIVGRKLDVYETPHHQTNAAKPASKPNVSERLKDTFKDVPDVQIKKQTIAFTVRVEWSGYSRGYSVYEVKASTQEEAIENYYNGERVEHKVVRDDTESQEVNVIKSIH